MGSPVGTEGGIIHPPPRETQKEDPALRGPSDAVRSVISGSTPPRYRSAHESRHHARGLPSMSYRPQRLGFFSPTGWVMKPALPMCQLNSSAKLGSSPHGK